MQALPRVLYAADVPVASTTAGSLLLYRLLRDYPGEKVLIAEGLVRSTPDTRLPKVRYAGFPVGWGRLLRTRFGKYYAPFVMGRAESRTGALSQLAAEHRAEVILTVAHNYSWLSAAAVARNLKLPLLFILHDDPWFHAGCPNLVRKWFEARLRAVCRQAHSCLCVSPNMAEWVEESYGARASLLYPSWDSNPERWGQPAIGTPKNTRPFTVAYAGNVFSDGYRTLISRLAESCSTLGFGLILFCNIPEQQKAALGLDKPNVLLHPLVPSLELPARLRACSDTLFVPMSFEDCDRRLMILSFPSKLAEYTGIGLPLLVWGPADCSAVRWARENPGVAEVVDQRDQRRLEAALLELASSPNYRQALAQAAFSSGQALFSYEKVVGHFFTELIAAVQRRVGSPV